jgi:uncharacterized protein with LGFP repeats
MCEGVHRVREVLAATMGLLALTGSLVQGVAPASAADCLTGPVADRYAALGGTPGALGAVTGCELPTADGRGRFSTFQRGAIYYSQASGAWDVSGSFRDLWASTGFENGPLHYPVSGEVGTRGGGVFQNYQGGTLYWSPASAAHSVSGAFLALYGSLGYENGFLGYPTSQEVPVRDGGVFQVFQGGVAYWSPTSGAHTVSGSFRDLYGTLGYENGCLGYPTSQELPSRDGGVYQQFQGGVAYWSPSSGAHALCGDLLRAYGSTGYENGFLGYPTSDEYGIAGGRRVDFQHGYVEWSPSTGARVTGPAVPVVTTPPPSTPPPTPPPSTPPTGVYYANCDAVRAAGAAPLYSGQPGYRSGLDRDHDGVACE